MVSLFQMKRFLAMVSLALLGATSVWPNNAVAQDVVPFTYSEARKHLQAIVDFEGPVFAPLLQSTSTSGYRAGGVQFGISFEHTQEKYQGPFTVAPNLKVVASKSRQSNGKVTALEGLFGVSQNQSQMLTTRKTSARKVHVEHFEVINGERKLVSSGLEDRSYDRIGRGSDIVFTFEAEQFLVGFQLTEFETALPVQSTDTEERVGRTYYVRLFRRDGSLLGDFRMPIQPNQYVAFQRCVGIRDIAGVWISARTPTGFAIDNLIYDSEPTEVPLEVKEQLEPCIGLFS